MNEKWYRYNKKTRKWIEKTPTKITASFVYFELSSFSYSREKINGVNHIYSNLPPKEFLAYAEENNLFND